jgi:hypothetical protein
LIIFGIENNADDCVVINFMNRLSEVQSLLPFKVWGITLILGAFFFFISQLLNGLEFSEALSFGFLAFFLSLFLSLPSFLIYLLFFRFVINRSHIKRRFKTVIALLSGLLLLILTFMVLEVDPLKSENHQDIIIISGYIVALIIATFMTMARTSNDR